MLFPAQKFIPRVNIRHAIGVWKITIEVNCSIEFVGCDILSCVPLYLYEDIHERCTLDIRDHPIENYRPSNDKSQEQESGKWKLHIPRLVVGKCHSIYI